MATDVDVLPSPRRAAPRRLPRRAVVAALVVLALTVAIAGWLGLRSRVDLQLTGSSLTGFSADTFVAEDPEPGAAVAVYRLQNDGPVPARIAVSAVRPQATLAVDLVWWGDEPQPPADAPGEARVDLAPGESVGVRLVLGVDCHGTHGDGIGYGPGALPLDVTALGLTREVLLDLHPRPFVSSEVAIPASC
ncbi:hypothetical protein [Actinotalea solisilvae]|uniref:hypothetical protein n=1 Tax=Actinotalea solisilvae TaxID=2072922 RepID=UPI0018F1443E|nr:hypothetical protein [Actinotalea solisilvae]